MFRVEIGPSSDLRILREILDRRKTFAKPLREVAELVHAATEEEFDREAFRGERGFEDWLPLARPRPGKILFRTGRLFRAATGQSSESKATVTSSRDGTATLEVKVLTPYASVHREGTDRVPQRNFMRPEENEELRQDAAITLLRHLIPE